MTDTNLQKIIFKGGFNKNTTSYGAENFWIDGDKVRFRNGRPEKLGGYVGLDTQQEEFPFVENFTGVARDIHSWTDLSFNKYLAVGSNKKVEQYFGGKIYDITPYRLESSLTDAISTTSGSSVVNITQVSHEAVQGDFVFVDSQATPVDGITLSGTYEVLTVVDADNYTIDSGTVASGTTSSSGGALEINYLLENGNQNNGNVTGYGGGGWNTPGASNGGYGTPRAGVGGTFLRQWSLDNWGEDLIACVRGGKIYQWDATSGLGTRLQQITGAPEENYAILIAQPSRHLVALGTIPSTGSSLEPLTIRWAEQETLTEWTITNTNTAGEYRLPLGNYIVGAVQTKSEILIFTDSSLYSMRYVGGNEIFQFDIISDNITATSQHSAIDYNGIVYWQGVDNFYYYNGSVGLLESTLEESIFDQDGVNRLEFAQKEKTFCSSISEFNEIIWLYQSENANEIDRYIIYNVADNTWYDGTYDRTVWMDKKVFSKPYAIDSSGVLYAHEEGKDADGSPLVSYLESGDIVFGEGDDFLFVDTFIPDFKLPDNRNITMTLKYKNYPNTEYQDKGPFTFTNKTKKINFRCRGRHFKVYYEVTGLGTDFEIGYPRFAFQADGERG